MCSDDCHCSRPGAFRHARCLSLIALLAIAALCMPAAPALADDEKAITCTPGVDTCPADSNPCTTEYCSYESHTCESRPKTCFAGDNPCLVMACNPENGQCEGTPLACEPDDNPCTVETCNPSNGSCESTPKVCSQDDNLCTVESCNPETGDCSSSPKDCAGDDNLCTVDACNPSTGQCASTPRSCAADDNLCTVEACDPSTGSCSSTPRECDADDNLCTVEACSPSTGSCASTPKTCAQDDNLCNVEVCLPESGNCESGPPKACSSDNDACTTESCNPATGSCTSAPTNPEPPECGETICRTPGFWGTHAKDDGCSRSGSSGAVNITQAVIEAAGGSLSVCGETIDSTTVGDDASAVEAICVSPAGTIRLQLARQLTAAALNCVISGGGASCAGTALYTDLFATCNAACINSGTKTAALTRCVDQLDCLNNGGKLLANGYCQTGTCRDGVTPCKVGIACFDGSTCSPLSDSCHVQELINEDLDLAFSSTGPAGSSKECNAAVKNSCVVIGSGQRYCPY